MDLTVDERLSARIAEFALTEACVQAIAAGRTLTPTTYGVVGQVGWYRATGAEQCAIGAFLLMCRRYPPDWTAAGRYISPLELAVKELEIDTDWLLGFNQGFMGFQPGQYSDQPMYNAGAAAGLRLRARFILKEE